MHAYSDIDRFSAADEDMDGFRALSTTLSAISKPQQYIQELEMQKNDAQKHPDNTQSQLVTFTPAQIRSKRLIIRDPETASIVPENVPELVQRNSEQHSTQMLPVEDKYKSRLAAIISDLDNAHLVSDIEQETQELVAMFTASAEEQAITRELDGPEKATCVECAVSHCLEESGITRYSKQDRLERQSEHQELTGSGYPTTSIDATSQTRAPQPADSVQEALPYPPKVSTPTPPGFSKHDLDLGLQSGVSMEDDTTDDDSEDDDNKDEETEREGFAD